MKFVKEKKGNIEMIMHELENTENGSNGKKMKVWVWDDGVNQASVIIDFEGKYTTEDLEQAFEKFNPPFQNIAEIKTSEDLELWKEWCEERDFVIGVETADEFIEERS